MIAQRSVSHLPSSIPSAVSSDTDTDVEEFALAAEGIEAGEDVNDRWVVSSQLASFKNGKPTRGGKRAHHDILHLHHFMHTDSASERVKVLGESVDPDDTLLDTARSTTRETRIIALAKRVRGLNLALERERSCTSALNARIKQLEKDATPNVVKPVNDDTARSNIQIKALKDKLSQTTRKLEEERTQNQNLRNENRLLTKALKQEVGDSVPLSKVLEEKSGWKGRAQQILVLKAKLSEITHTTPPPQPPTNNIRKLETSRRAAHEKVQMELETLREEHASLVKKAEALLARNRTLEKANQTLKTTLSTLLQKTSSSSKLVSVLQTKVASLQAKRDQQPDQDLLSVIEAKDKHILEQAEQINNLQHSSSLILTTPSPTSQHSPASPVVHDITITSLQATLKNLSAENKHLRTLQEDTKARLAHVEEKMCRMEAQLKRANRKNSEQKKTEETDMDRLTCKLDLLRDENEGLKTTLESTRTQHTQETSALYNLLAQTRQAFASDVEKIVKYVQDENE
ncbi:hypothetical protein SpCBS45565_g05229 [Spizellomyces sp. 'palustris']|nr:hypothetical protein SpCBS45565_g05229 [Spizellomyces sp. 'palustris']